MSSQRRPARQTIHASRSTPARPACRSVRQPFRFGNLPIEIRDKIYRLRLLNETAIPIVVDDPGDFDGEPLSEGQIFGNPDLVQLTTRINRFRGERFSTDVGLIYINSTIHDEAAAVLYGRNPFKVVGGNSWINFFYFHRRLTGVGRQHLRQLKISLPDIERFNTAQTVGQLNEFGEEGIKILKHLPSLGDLTFRVGEDIMAADIELLRRIRDACQRQCRIVMDIRKALLYHDPDGFDDRPVRISSSAIQKMR